MRCIKQCNFSIHIMAPLNVLPDADTLFMSSGVPELQTRVANADVSPGPEEAQEGEEETEESLPATMKSLIADLKYLNREPCTGRFHEVANRGETSKRRKIALRKSSSSRVSNSIGLGSDVFSRVNLRRNLGLGGRSGGNSDPGSEPGNLGRFLWTGWSSGTLASFRTDSLKLGHTILLNLDLCLQSLDLGHCRIKLGNKASVSVHFFL
ncbi:hypothetical protein CKAN_00136300 [Cinnamomum micranthum f. kanehirae]|uniref:Uncharacterized protein n=1 Tax=Cinnamomum micranthum f. kanehirae TaxID=337451 RepID=A0A443N3P0_9MAGN|nr:hypothetical protein CKAN_00136300 [Cinnamomum micranthum f. kanehirae]